MATGASGGARWRGSARARGYTKRWERAALAFRREHPLCAKCSTAARPVPSRVVDHITPHKGDPVLFWDRRNWQALCKECHDRKTATEDGGGFVGTTRPAWLKPSRVPVVVVCGAPGSGKSTIVRELAGPGDLVLDLDEVKAGLAGVPLYQAGAEWVSPALRERNARLATLAGSPTCSRAWLIVSAPLREERAFWRETLGELARVVVVEWPVLSCVARIMRDERRGARRAEHAQAAREWWVRYVDDAADEVLRPGAPEPQTLATIRETRATSSGDRAEGGGGGSISTPFRGGPTSQGTRARVQVSAIRGDLGGTPGGRPDGESSEGREVDGG